MPISSGPNTAGESNLVFNYDTGDTVNSYKGEPTTNLVPYSEYQYLADGYTEALGGWDTYEGTMLIDANNKVPGYTNRSIKMTCVQANVYKYHFSVPLTNGQTYTVSFWGKAAVASNYGNFLLGDGPGGYLVFEPGGYSSVTTEFTRFKYTFTLSSPTGTYNFATYLYGDGSVVWLSGFQIENKSHATQYLPSNVGPTTRSVTQGLLDITGYGNSINLTNMSYDLNAQPIFDGTDDYISIPDNSAMKPSTELSVELIIKASSITPNWNNIFGKTPYTNSWLIFFETGGTLIRALHNVGGTEYRCNTTRAISTTDYTHIVFTFNTGDAIRSYFNGASGDGTVSLPAGTFQYSGTDAFTIGYAGSSWFNGLIPIARVYNRALSASEIAQNYNQLKTRFNLS